MGFQQLEMTVSEDVGMVLVCVQIISGGPSQEEEIVRVSSTDDSAISCGKSIRILKQLISYGKAVMEHRLNLVLFHIIIIILASVFSNNYYTLKYCPYN